ncbi:MAG: hypothetical protein C0621_04635 [Desulfuromonas sp.]|nr:MAG: hypothetical protein C0621_04635 [Desulfuromonas sp.]
MSAEKYTVLLIPEGSHRVRRLTLKRGLVRSVVACVFMLVLAMAWVVTDYVHMRVDRQELHQLRSANLQQRQDLQRLAATLDDLRQEMVVIAQNDAKVRVLAQLTPSHSDALTGIGGPPEDEGLSAAADLQRRIDELRQSIDLRRESQEEIQGVLNDQRSLLAARPKGLPTKGWMTSGFGMRNSPFTGKRKMHEGVDIAARTGTPIYASADGIVSRSETAVGYGKLVVIDHGYGYKTYYGHNSKLFVKVGQRVKRGDKIAAVGNTGTSTGSHVHYEVRLNNVPINPKKFL